MFRFSKLYIKKKNHKKNFLEPIYLWSNFRYFLEIAIFIKLAIFMSNLRNDHCLYMSRSHQFWKVKVMSFLKNLNFLFVWFFKHGRWPNKHMNYFIWKNDILDSFGDFSKWKFWWLSCSKSMQQGYYKYENHIFFSYLGLVSYILKRKNIKDFLEPIFLGSNLGTFYK